MYIKVTLFHLYVLVVLVHLYVIVPSFILYILAIIFYLYVSVKKQEKNVFFLYSYILQNKSVK